MGGKMNRKIGISILIFFVLLSGCISDQNAGKGSLHLTSSPSGAEVYLDNQFRGSTPSTIPDVVLGSHTLEFRYPGYQSWSKSITVSSGSSYYYAELIPKTNNQLPLIPTILPPDSQNKVKIQADKSTMIVGDSNTFSGTAMGNNSVELTLYGPGYYAKGVVLDQPKTNPIGSWNYRWNPGFAIQSGVYTMVVNDAQKISSDRVDFSVVGGGEVSISANTYAAARGDTIRFSGRCTTGAHNVLLVLYGPGQFSGGVELGSLSVTGDKTWNFRYSLDNTMPTGSYTMYVYDIPKTTSSTTQFTVGFTS
jgi:hypothetical protein